MTDFVKYEGIEVFRAVGKESTELKIMDAVQYLKDHKTLGFDLVRTNYLNLSKLILTCRLKSLNCLISTKAK